ncbi:MULTISPECIES: hypothetical protein [Corallococcus]|uniref:hypothetical protein n=1 Tax=Corallococcus TaxID=83461 RepID=UPI001315200D|nr:MULTISPECIES: hypothetical protein [Corallococcus]
MERDEEAGDTPPVPPGPGQVLGGPRGRRARLARTSPQARIGRWRTAKPGKLVEATGNADLEALFVFHGGWHTFKSFAFDSRVVSTTGERAIIPFDESMQKPPRPMKRERVQPFGLWLHKRASQLVRTAEGKLRELL